MESKQVLSIEQMQHLQELGLKLKPSLVHYYKIINIDSGKWYLSTTTGDISHDSPTYRYIPAYTLQDVLDALPASIKHKDFRYHLVYNKSEGFIVYYRVDFDGNHRYARYEEIYNGIEGLSVIDAAYSLLCWAIEQGYVETNKNE